MSDSPRCVGSLAVTLYDQFGNKLVNADNISLGQVIRLQKGRNVVGLKIENLYLNPGTYVLGLWLANLLGEIFDDAESVINVEVIDIEFEGLGRRAECDGVVKCNFNLFEVT